MIEQKDNQIKDNKRKLVLLKTQKLSSALYVVTNFLPDQDPIKWRLRDLALALLNKVHLNYTLSASQDIGLNDQALPTINEISSLIEIAKLDRSASQMNYSILQKEYLSLGEMIKEIETNTTLLEQLPVPTVYFPLNPEEARREISSRPSDLTRPPVANLAIKDKSKGQSLPRDRADNSRQQVILKFIKSRGWSSIKDIASAVPNFSSKTVQRELSQMVRRGLLKREGDRRWSRYLAI